MKSLIKSINTFIFLLACIYTTQTFAQTSEAEAIIGLWLPSNGKARVNITKGKDAKYHGRIVWLREPNNEQGKPKVDKNNPDEAKRNTPLMGYSLLKDFTYQGNNIWEGGTIYDPENGSTYSCEIKLIDSNTIEVRGYIGVSLFGRTDTWKRIQVKSPTNATK